MSESKLQRQISDTAAEFEEIVTGGGMDDVWVVVSVAGTLAEYLAGTPSVWGKFKAMVEAKAAAKRYEAYVRANPAVGVPAAIRAAQDAFPEWTALGVCDACEHGLYVAAESGGMVRRILVVHGAGGEWLCTMGAASVGLPAGTIE